MAVTLGLASVLLQQQAYAAERATWFVDADATAGGTGSRAKPFATLARAEQASRPSDRIIVLPSAKALDGGIALKPGQRLIGRPGAILTNTTERLDGDAVRLADRTTVRGLTIVAPRRGGIYGDNVTAVVVAGNDISGHNASCVPGFLIPEFNAPTNLPGVGIPIRGGLQNGWAGIMLDAASGSGSAVVRDNRVHSADCGDGIDVRTYGRAEYAVTIRGNDVTRLRQGPDFKSVLAIGLQSNDESTLTARVDRNTQSELGNDDELNFAVSGADSEGVFVNGVGPSTLHATVTRNHYTNERGIGGFSANGLEMVTMGAGSRVTTIVRDSYFSGSPGDVIEEGALGTDATLTMVLDNVVAERSTGVGNTFVLPFNNGDCVLAGSLGARNSVKLTVVDSTLRDCSNNGLSFGNNVVNGRGATTSLELDVRDSVITGNQGANLGVRNFSDLERLRVRVEGTDLSDSVGVGGSGIANAAFEDLGGTADAVIDLGGGALGSAGGNCLAGGVLAADVLGYDVTARDNLWGAAGTLLRTVVVRGTLDVRGARSTCR